MLRGASVVLRAVEREDLPHLWRWRNDLELFQLVEGDPPAPVSLERFRAEFEERLEGPGVEFAIDVEGRLIGRCGMFEFDELARNAKIGVTIGDRDLWGKGIGRDVVEVLLAYAFHERHLHRVWLDVLATNERALRCYQASGFVEEGRQREHAWVDGEYVDLVLMGVLRDEWEAGGAPPSASG